MKQAYTLLFVAVLLAGTSSAQTLVFDSYGNFEENFSTLDIATAATGFRIIEDYQIDQSTFSTPGQDSFVVTSASFVTNATSNDGGGVEVSFAFAGNDGSVITTFNVLLAESPGTIYGYNLPPTVVPANGLFGIFLDTTSAANSGRQVDFDIWIANPGATGIVGTSPGNNFGTFPDGEIAQYAFALEGNERQTTLPVELASFDAEADDRGIALDWTTAQEFDNAGFEVERSTDGEDFAAVGFVEGAGQSDAATDYAYTDVAVIAGETYYYRLRQLDYDGAEHYSPVRVVSTGSLEGDAYVSEFAPNPARQDVSIDIDLRESAEVSTELYDVTGKRVLVRRSAADAGVVTETLDVSTLPAGVYQAVITAGGQIVQRRLTVK